MTAEEIMNEEILLLRKEVAKVWEYSRWFDSKKCRGFAIKAFLTMPIGSRKGKSSSQILDETYQGFIKENRS
jgi:hypothetical protein